MTVAPAVVVLYVLRDRSIKRADAKEDPAIEALGDRSMSKGGRARGKWRTSFLRHPLFERMVHKL